MLLDYTKDSLAIVYSHADGSLEPSHSRFKGLQAIGDMSDDLWAAMDAQVVDDSIGLRFAGGVPHVKVGITSVRSTR